MTTSPSRPPDPPRIRNEVPAGACKSCGTEMPADRSSPLCASCCREFNVRSAAVAKATAPVLRRASRFHWFAISIALAFLLLLVAIGAAAASQRSVFPAALSPTFRAIHFVLLVASLWTCVELDAAARQFPALPWMPRSRADAIAKRLEGVSPGAALSMLAVLLPWSIGIHDRSPALLVVYLTLSCATIATAATLWYRMRSYQRMRAACQADSAQRLLAWRSVHVHRRGTIAVVAWVAIPCLIAALPLLGIGRPYTTVGPGWIESAAWRALGVSLYLAALLWFVAFIDATRSLRRWIPRGA